MSKIGPFFGKPRSTTTVGDPNNEVRNSPIFRKTLVIWPVSLFANSLVPCQKPRYLPNLLFLKFEKLDKKTSLRIWEGKSGLELTP